MLTYMQIKQVEAMADAYDFVTRPDFHHLCPADWATNPSFRLDGLSGAMLDQFKSDSRYFDYALKMTLECLAVGYADKNDVLKESAEKAFLLIEHLYRHDPEIQRNFDKIFSAKKIVLKQLKEGAPLETVLWVQRIVEEENRRTPASSVVIAAAAMGAGSASAKSDDSSCTKH